MPYNSVDIFVILTPQHKMLDPLYVSNLVSGLLESTNVARDLEYYKSLTEILGAIVNPLPIHPPAPSANHRFVL